jgi:3-deoxy-manno-octulosonate cytidylyltransferase (CMP-KDO synthetase)
MITGSLAVIPARLGSVRLPRKPLQLIAGRPLIEWVWRRVVDSDLFSMVVIATESEEVAAAARGFGAEVEMTDAGHVSGTDRVAEVADHGRFRGYPLIVNVQGDEPFLRDDALASAARLVLDGWHVGTIASVIRTSGELHDPAVVKVVRGADGGAMYFSRSAIPFARDRAVGREDFSLDLYLRHIGIYAYSRDALFRWVELEESVLERTERLEQLRPLAAGVRIGVDVVPSLHLGIDTPEDLERARQILSDTSAREPETL